MFLVSLEHVCEIPWGTLVEHPLQAPAGHKLNKMSQGACRGDAWDAAAEWTSQWLRSSKLTAKYEQKKHTGTSNVAKPGFVLAGCWLSCRLRFLKKGTASCCPWDRALLCFSINWMACSKYLTPASKIISQDTKYQLSLGPKRTRFVYLLLVYLAVVTRNTGSRSHHARCRMQLAFLFVAWIPPPNSTVHHICGAQY